VKLVFFALPLALDTFAVSAALGMAQLPRRRRLELALLMTGFELAMPVVGLLVGHGVGGALGRAAHYVAAAALVALGVYMLAGDDDEVRTNVHGLALIGLGLSISLDELAIGFSFGLLHVSLAWALVLIAVQAFVAAQLGLWLGARVGAALRERAEQAAGVALIALAAVVLFA
jgi:manganese efflux pump family protein